MKTPEQIQEYVHVLEMADASPCGCDHRSDPVAAFKCSMGAFGMRDSVMTMKWILGLEKDTPTMRKFVERMNNLKAAASSGEMS